MSLRRTVHTLAWVLAGMGGTMLFVALWTYDARKDAALAGLVALLGLVLLSQGWRLGRVDRRIRDAQRDKTRP